jgi:small-conductance mechanosensitive channel
LAVSVIYYDITNLLEGVGNMKKNMGTIDRTIRILLAILIAVLYFTNQISGLAAIILGIVAIAFLITSIVGYCPLYVPLKISTIKKA